MPTKYWKEQQKKQEFNAELPPAGIPHTPAPYQQPQAKDATVADVVKLLDKHGIRFSE